MENVSIELTYLFESFVVKFEKKPITAVDEKKTGNNYVTTLPPVNPDNGTRVGYFTTDEQLIDSLPFRTNMQNILY